MTRPVPLAAALMAAVAMLAAPHPALGQAAPAQQAADAAAAFRAGRWAAVTDAGRAERTADALALSARALLVRAAYLARTRSEALALIAEAERDAAAAVALDPANREALLQRAAALGYRARFERSRSKGAAGRDQLRDITRRFPDWDAGWIALALWHGEALDTLGRLVARTALGASSDAMGRDFARAAALDPASPVTPAAQGMMLLRLGEGDPEAARRLLARAQSLPARDAYEALLQRQAAQVLAELDRAGVKAARQRAQALAPFAAIEG